MKKVGLILLLSVMISLNAKASDVIHGINVDEVFSSADWSSEQTIKDIIKDYGLLLEYQEELANCSNETQKISCYDNVAEKVLANLYVYPKENIEAYQQYVKATENAYEISTCRIKHTGTSGNLCDLDSRRDILISIQTYIQVLLNNSKNALLSQIPALENYRETD